MTEPGFDERQALFTIGHSNHEMERFLQLLKENEIEVLVDMELILILDMPPGSIRPIFKKRFKRVV